MSYFVVVCKVSTATGNWNKTVERYENLQSAMSNFFSEMSNIVLPSKFKKGMAFVINEYGVVLKKDYAEAPAPEPESES